MRSLLWYDPRAGRRGTKLGALGLVLNAIVLWNTRYMDAALRPLRDPNDPDEILNAGAASA